MPRKCIVFGCKNSLRSNITNEKKVSFHVLPKDEIQRNQWINRICLLNNQKEVPLGSLVCDNHFQLNDFCGNKKTFLTSDAVPSIFPMLDGFSDISCIIDADTCKEEDKSCCSAKQISVLDSPVLLPESPSSNGPLISHLEVQVAVEVNAQGSCSGSTTLPTTSTPVKSDVTLPHNNSYSTPRTSKKKVFRYPGDIHDDTELTPKTTKKYVSITQAKLKNQTKVIYNLKRRVKRQKNRIMSLRGLIKEIKKKFGLSDHAKQSIESTYEDDIIAQLKVGRQTKSYNENVRSFALTLNFYSPAAYRYVRKTFGNHLPAPSTLHNWYKTINGDPGISAEALSILKSRVDKLKAESKTLYVALMADEMSIRTQLIWNETKKKYIGYVDHGLRSEDTDDTEEASDALVFMVVPINSNGKLPISYYLTNKFSGEEKANLVKQMLAVINETGAEVLSFTFDGATSNITMAKALGADLDDSNMVTSFINPSTKRRVFIFLDICHMMKLIRNNLGSKGILYDIDGNKVKWDYIKELEKIQREQGLHLGTKITLQHINYHNNKMKVKLATQVFSKSVADALEYCRTRYSQFEGCEATVKFIRLFNDLFDVLNSKSFNGKGCKHPFQKSNFEEFSKLFNEAKKYIKGLQIMVPKTKGNVVIFEKKNVVTSGIKRGFNGFLVGASSFKSIFDSHVLSGKLRYLLGFKFSQDHLETLFSVIRSRGGFNNNPNCLQFKTSFKQILMRNQISSSINANCKFDETQVLHFSNLIASTTNNVSDSNLFRKDNPELGADVFDELNTFRLSEYVSDVVSYVSGFVQRHLERKLKCKVCKQTVSSNAVSSNLIALKNRGGLIIPNKDIMKICKISENELWSCDIKKRNFYDPLVSRIMLNLIDENLFVDLHHSSKAIECEHRISMTKAIIDVYLKIRLHHIAKHHNINKKKSFIRSKLTKLIHFTNQ